jgi:hypothetical protein
VVAGIADYNPVYVTTDEGVRYMWTTHTSRIESRWYDTATGEVSAVFAGRTDVPTHFDLFDRADSEITAAMVDVPTFDDKVVVACKRDEV